LHGAHLLFAFRLLLFADIDELRDLRTALRGLILRLNRQIVVALPLLPQELPEARDLGRLGRLRRLGCAMELAEARNFGVLLP